MGAMTRIIDMLGWQLFNILSLTGAVFYFSVVILGYATEGPGYQIRFNLAHPFRSIVRVFVGIGIKAMNLLVRLGSALVDPLVEAGADVGEWVIGRTSEETQARYRSRFI